MARKAARLPAAVLERARKVSLAPRPPPPPEPPAQAVRRLPKNKIVVALRALHPMD